MNSFRSAKTVWPVGFREHWNQIICFLSSFETQSNENISIRITAADAYRIWCNDTFVGYGPARTAKGYARIDEWEISNFTKDGINNIAIEVISHGIDSYIYPYHKPFFIAEIYSSDICLAATPEGFTAHHMVEHIEKVERYSKQRAFAEAYHLTPSCFDYRKNSKKTNPIKLECIENINLIARGVRYPNFNIVKPVSIFTSGRVDKKDSPPEIKTAGRRGVGKRYRGFLPDECSIDMVAELNAFEYIIKDNVKKEIHDCSETLIPAQFFTQFDFGKVQGGFIGIELNCEKSTRVYLEYDEINQRPPEEAFALGIGAISLDLEAGEHHFESIEPYSLRYLRVISLNADIKIKSPYIREYVHPKTDVVNYQHDDKELELIFEAGIQTFKTNAIDLFTDCPSRERGGYPCDSWFTAQAERVLTGESVVERNFLENFFLTNRFTSIPDGMLPHCYPSEQYGKGQYIPNWSMWLVIQLCHYCENNNDPVIQNLAKPRVEALVKFFEPYFNEVGLLEDLPSWVFVEWSQANECTDGVNYPSNMLYYQCLLSAAKLYKNEQWKEIANKLKLSILEHSWNGRYFADQSTRKNGQLVQGQISSETCQYHAFYFGIADRKHHGILWDYLRDNWGPLRGMKVIFSHVYKRYEFIYEDGSKPKSDDKDLVPAGLLYGLMLRFELLIEYDDKKNALAEIKSVFGNMAKTTGSLWEHNNTNSSLNHGFASAACRYLLDLQS